jgi:hypothetical protein
MYIACDRSHGVQSRDRDTPAAPCAMVSESESEPHAIHIHQQRHAVARSGGAGGDQ